MSEPGTISARSGLGYAFVVSALVAIVALMALRAGKPPEPLPRSAPKASFSAERAMEHVAELARAPRPVGTEAHAAVAEYLLDQLEGLGLEAEIQEATWVRGFGPGRQTAARVRNVLGRLPGAEGGGTLLLMAHYDSQPQTLGAGDDAAGVATILESLRALVLEAPLDNEIIVALTDAEEIGLVGADAFVELHPWFERVDRTLNFEGRGQRGAALMFETADGGLASARDLARHAPFPAANSTSYEVYRRMPNDTDFSVIRRAGGHGLNFAFIGDLPAYHSLLDTADRLDRGTLQHMGSNALAMARHYANSQLEAPEARDGVYFNPWGLRPLWVLDARAAQVASVLALALAVAAFLSLRTRGEMAVSGVPLGWGLVLFGVGVAMGLTWAAWRLLGDGPSTPYGIPFDSGVAALGLALLGISAWCFSLTLWKGGAWSIQVAVVLLWSVTGVLVAWYVTGLSHLFVLPSLLMAASLLVGQRLGLRWLPAVGGLLPSVLVWAPALSLSYLALTVRAAVVLSVVALLAATLLTPAFAWLRGAQARVVSLLVLLVGLVLVGWAVHGTESTADRPRVDTLFLFHERDGEKSTWFSLDREVDDWTSGLLGTAPERQPLPEVLDSRQREVLSAPASVAAPAGTLQIVRERDDRPGGGRSVAFRLRSSAASLRIKLHANVALSKVSIDGRSCAVDESGELRISLHGRATDGFLLEAEMDDRWPLYLEVIEISYGLPSEVGERPNDLIPRPGWWTDTTMVHSSVTL